MARSTDEILDEVCDDVRGDRETLETVRARLVRATEFADGDLSLSELAGGIAKLSDCLTRSTAQLVEIAKLRVRKSKTAPQGSMDRDEVFEQLGEGNAN